MRKAVTIVLSFLLFSKPFTINYIFSGLIVLVAIYLNVGFWITQLKSHFTFQVYSKNPAKFDLIIRKWLYRRKASGKESIETYNV
jgi:adenosine 3'-phospho 5'-phosphosulfate transporter B3